LRYERKFIIPASEKNLIRVFLNQNIGFFSEIFQKRKINNIYFDSLDHTSFHENEIGTAFRKKIRIRWYGNCFGVVNEPILEIKIKNGYLGNKKRYKISPLNIDSKLNRNTILKNLMASKIPDPLIDKIKSMNPILMNSYDRKYFLSKNKKFRLTIDEKVTFYYICLENHFTRKFIDRYNLIVEIKYDKKNDDFLEKITNQLPFRLSKNSKYVKGILSLNQF